MARKKCKYTWRPLVAISEPEPHTSSFLPPSLPSGEGVDRKSKGKAVKRRDGRGEEKREEKKKTRAEEKRKRKERGEKEERERRKIKERNVTLVFIE